ncbi:MAG: 2-(1,2-epoxy-1,2-dihydrophenyl)acetyl-CoA isomerase [Candidatus Fluviicola riflensis]|nr:MAG: 2-(1,2-epoxy-1,2-dihydrophenyl)acetyl-CoA isomerase [Candidatus Fluviicola riflensis]OGS76934.1 MAG: 2-(1,2-epoxy-1,2-dihydrophenyl)acetyl-CoA isomerase [Candidatus Fluviicola riflensis]OGS81863.1 MAG: 2-(1,2-epoxy-1,2-dihydrophenyl)acetyl-CoA isomerase [Fluviicola sp. RIFCSPHIGHO2_01_FULL_43_53]OGS88662.1 MAG: 2-(1,2-epoxy-1,2-dihydrophenyl)acetyl-CoA isomerase [Fluviicola sp. RIFCSPHIGHO2_12_FULL_43_24]
MELKITHSNGVCTITLNRPEVFNSFNKVMAIALQDALDDCASNDKVRAIVITGEGKAFCAGQDLAEATDPNGPELRSIVRDHYNPIIERIRALEKPVIAAVNGVAAGAGANIALACDLTIAKQSASFIQAFSKIGLIPDSGGTFFLPRIVGMQKALGLMMTGDKVTAEQADAMNMIYKAVPDESFEEEVTKLAETLAKMPTRGLGLTKKAVNQSFSNDLTEQLALEEELQTEAGQTEDFSEGVNAFLEKRKPEFVGR